MQLLILLGAIAAVASAVVLLRRRSRRKFAALRVGFREYVRQPSLRARVSNHFAQAPHIVKKLSKQPPGKLVAMLLDDERFGIAKRAINTAGNDVVPHLLDALSKNEFRRKVTQQTNESTHLFLRRSMPLVTVLECLSTYAPLEAVPAVANLISDEDREIRKNAAYLLGVIGDNSTVDLLNACLSDSAESVRTNAVRGIQKAIEAQRASPQFRDGIFNAVRNVALSCEPMESENAAKCLLRLDRERAIQDLTTDEALTPEREGLHALLGALRSGSVSVDERKLLRVVQAIEATADEYPNDYLLGEALQCLARCNSEFARAAIARGTNSKSRRVRLSATAAMAEARGIREPFIYAFNRLDLAGWNALTIAQQHVLAVRIFVDEINNGGFSQYFVNDSGNHWRDAESGLSAIEASADHLLLQSAVAKFGPNGPSTDPLLRHQELACLVREDDELFSPLESVFYKDESDREVLLLRYIMNHPQDFC